MSGDFKMLVKCKECDKEYELDKGTDPSNYQCDCGGNLKKIRTDPVKLFKSWFKLWESSKDPRIIILSFIGLIFVCVFAVTLIATTAFTYESNQINISNDEYTHKYSTSGYVMEYVAELTPNKDFNYLRMVTVWYDSEGNVIKQDKNTWNVNSAVAGQTYKINSKINLDSEPFKIRVLVFDSPDDVTDESKAIYKQNIKLT